MVAFAPGFPLLIAARLILGIAVGGLWSMVPALALRLVPPSHVSKALAIIFAGVSVATVAMLPLATALETKVGWRPIFLGFAVFGVLAALGQTLTLPRLPVALPPRGLPVLRVIKRPGIALAIGTMLLCFSGHFALYTYVRPMLQQIAHFSADEIASVLLLYGLSNLIGNLLSVRLLRASLQGTLVFMPIALATAAFALVLVSGHKLFTAAMMVVWGMAYATLPVGWSTWMARSAPEEAEAAGGALRCHLQPRRRDRCGCRWCAVRLQGHKGSLRHSGCFIGVVNTRCAPRIRHTLTRSANEQYQSSTLGVSSHGKAK